MVRGGRPSSPEDIFPRSTGITTVLAKEVLPCLKTVIGLTLPRLSRFPARADDPKRSPCPLGGDRFIGRARRKKKKVILTPGQKTVFGRGV